MNKTVQQPETSVSTAIIGEWRRFGEFGIVYQIIAVEDEKNVKIKVLDTGGELSYSLADALNDPIAEII